METLRKRRKEIPEIHLEVSTNRTCVFGNHVERDKGRGRAGSRNFKSVEKESVTGRSGED